MNSSTNSTRRRATMFQLPSSTNDHPARASIKNKDKGKWKYRTQPKIDGEENNNAAGSSTLLTLESTPDNHLRRRVFSSNHEFLTPSSSSQDVGGSTESVKYNFSRSFPALSQQCQEQKEIRQQQVQASSNQKTALLVDSSCGATSSVGLTDNHDSLFGSIASVMDGNFTYLDAECSSFDYPDPSQGENQTHENQYIISSEWFRDPYRLQSPVDGGDDQVAFLTRTLDLMINPVDNSGAVRESRPSSPNLVTQQAISLPRQYASEAFYSAPLCSTIGPEELFVSSSAPSSSLDRSQATGSDGNFGSASLPSFSALPETVSHFQVNNSEKVPKTLNQESSKSRFGSSACDLCRKRKVKCDRQQPSCEFCTRRGARCTSQVELRKRGPPTKAQRTELMEAGFIYDRVKRRWRLLEADQE